jgi:hypothetical protein
MLALTTCITGLLPSLESLMLSYEHVEQDA